MKRRIISTLLMMTLIISVFAEPAIALDTTVTEDEILNQLVHIEGDTVYIEDTNVSLDMMKKYYTISEEELEEINSRANQDSVANAPSSTRANTVYGPYTTISIMPTKAMAIVLSNLQGQVGVPFYPVEYNGASCYKFTSGSDVVYVKTNAFTRQSSEFVFPGQTSISSSLSYNANNKNTDYVTSSHGSSVAIVDGAEYVWSLSLIGSQVFNYSSTEIVAKSAVLYTTRFTAYTDSILVNGNQTESLSPELSIDIINSGTKGTYFGGFYIKGEGSRTSTKDISDWINIGYSTYQLFQSIGTLNIGTFNKLYNTAVNLTSSGIVTVYYESGTQPLSNESKKIYAYNGKMKCPYLLADQGDYYEMHIGLNKPGSDVRYNISLQYNF